MNGWEGGVRAATRWVEDHIDHAGWAARSARVGDVELSLDRMERFVHLLGDPQTASPVIHVSGTNGKGSTSRMITRLLMAEGLHVGTYSSPHLAKYNERFRVDDTDIDDRTLGHLLGEMANAEKTFGERLMPFEILTAAAFTWFGQRHVDVAVIEVGVLGRFDATNVAEGRVAVVTNIGFDHTTGEGDWQRRIADEKAGIIKRGAHLILGPVDSRLESVFRAQGPDDIWRMGSEIMIEADLATTTGRLLSIATPLQTLIDLVLPLRGAHQSTNCALAIAGASVFLGRALDKDHVAAALAAVRLPARMEMIHTGSPGSGPTVVLDGAHNPDAAAALALALRDGGPATGRRTLIIGLLTGRDPHAMLAAVEAEAFDEIVTCTPPTARARAAADVAAAAVAMGCPARPIDDIRDALAHSLAAARTGDEIVVTGSIYLVADARAWLTAAALVTATRPD